MTRLAIKIEPATLPSVDQWDLSLLDAAEGRAILWRLAVRCPPGCGTMCLIGVYYALIAELVAANDG